MAILDQLGLDRTFFTEFAIFCVLFVTLSKVYFVPFLRLFEARHKRVIEDRESAEKLLATANQKLEEYQQRLTSERQAARQEYEALLAEARKDESTILASARNEAKKITQEALDSANKQRLELRSKLEADIEGLAQSISEKLLTRRNS